VRAIHVALTVALVGSVVLGGAFLVRRDRQTSAELERLRSDVAQVKNAPARKFKTAREKFLAAAPQPAPGPTAAASDPSPAPRASEEAEGSVIDEEREHRLQVINVTRLERCKTTHASEAADPEWSAKATRDLQNVFASDEYKVLQASADCRTTICRVDLTYPETEAGATAVSRLAMIRPWKAVKTFSHLDIAKRGGTIYVTRESYDLPDVDPATLKY
jgi:hypothetical protein